MICAGSLESLQFFQLQLNLTLFQFGVYFLIRKLWCRIVCIIRKILPKLAITTNATVLNRTLLHFDKRNVPQYRVFSCAWYLTLSRLFVIYSISFDAIHTSQLFWPCIRNENYSNCMRNSETENVVFFPLFIEKDTSSTLVGV